MKEFAFYKGDKFLGLGTMPEIAQRLDIKVKTIRYYRTTAYRKKINEGKIKYEKARFVVDLDEKEPIADQSI